MKVLPFVVVTCSMPSGISKVRPFTLTSLLLVM